MGSEIKLLSTLERDASVKFTERRSVFIGHASPAGTEEEAVMYIKRKKSEYSDATHNVYAYMLGNGSVARYSDDGEPQGTAGIPVLDIIRKNNFTNAVIVVTRYFGGILLGAGGLVRAYSTAAKMAVDEAHIVTYEGYTEFTLKCTYSDYQRIKSELPRYGVITDGSDFTDEVTLYLAVKDALFDCLKLKISEMTAGKALPFVTGARYGCK